MFLTAGCASKGVKSVAGSSDEFEQDNRLFSDWQYKGFGSEYPVWAETVLSGDEESIYSYFSEFNELNKPIIITTQDSNLDICKILADEKCSQMSLTDEENLVTETWVKINPRVSANSDSEGVENPYIYIKLYSRSKK